MRKPSLPLYLGSALLLTVGAFYSCGAPTPAPATDSDSILLADSIAGAEGQAGEPEAASEPATRWQYSEETDEMTDKTNYFAQIGSENTADFDFPYEGGSKLWLTLRNHAEYGKDICIQISRGQFNANIIDGQTVTLRFDDEKPFTVTGMPASDGSMDLLFLRNYKKIAEKLKTAKKLLIKVEFFQEGNRTFTFDVEGLQWEH